jgi:hypothetical protein
MLAACSNPVRSALFVAWLQLGLLSAAWRISATARRACPSGWLAGPSFTCYRVYDVYLGLSGASKACAKVKSRSSTLAHSSSFVSLSDTIDTVSLDLSFLVQAWPGATLAHAVTAEDHAFLSSIVGYCTSREPWIAPVRNYGNTCTSKNPRYLFWSIIRSSK